jgi:hypothetical protein
VAAELNGAVLLRFTCFLAGSSIVSLVLLVGLIEEADGMTSAISPMSLPSVDVHGNNAACL